MILWSQKDIQDHYGVSRSTAHNWVRRERFPEPVGEPACGDVWDAWDVTASENEWMPSIGRPRGS